MANLLLHDGFDNYTIGNTGTGLAANTFLNVSNVWTYSGSSAAMSLVPGAYGGQEVRLTINNIMYRTLSATAGSVTAGFRLYSGATVLSQNNSSMRLLSGGTAGTTQIMLSVLSSGAIQITRGATIGTNVLATSATGIIGNSSYHYIEISVFRNASTGTLSVKVDGTTVITATGLNTGSADFDTIGLQGAATSGLPFGYDDLYVIDSLTPLGEVRIEPLYPDANDSVTWTPYDFLSSGNYPFISASSTQSTSSTVFQISYTSRVPAVGNWLIVLSQSGGLSTLPTDLNTGWTQAAAQLIGTSLAAYCPIIYYKQITQSDIDTLSTNTTSALSVGPFQPCTVARGAATFVWFEVSYDGIDLFLDALTSYSIGASTTGAANLPALPSITGAGDDLWAMTICGYKSTTVPVLNGGYTYTGSNTTSEAGGGTQSTAYGWAAIASGANFTPSITFSGTSTTNAFWAHLVIPRKYLVNYKVVDDVRIDGDLTYNYTTSTTDSDQFTLSDPVADPTTIHFVIPRTVARKDDAASRSITPNIVSGGVAGGSPVATPLTASYAIQQNVYALDPNTSAAWTYSALTSLKLKYTAGT